jgi:hypothetical protein
MMRLNRNFFNELFSCVLIFFMLGGRGCHRAIVVFSCEKIWLERIQKKEGGSIANQVLTPLTPS